MKRILIAALVCIGAISCGETETENTMTVSGQVKGLKKGTLYLQYIPDSILISIDSLAIDGDGSFSFKTELESPEVFYLYLNKNDNNEVNDRITFFGEPGTISINTSWNTFDTQAKIEGSKSHKKLEEYTKVMSRFNMKDLEITQAAFDPELQKDSLAMDSIQKERDRNVKRGYLYALNFALNNKASYIAPYIALKEVPDANIKYLDSIYSSLTSEVADSKYGLELNSYLNSLKKE